MGSANSSKQSSQTSYDPQLKAAFLGNYEQAQQRVADNPFQAYTGKLSADFSGTPLNQATDLTTGAAGPITGAQLSGYMSPYVQNVVDTTANDLDRQRRQQLVSNAGQATQAGAFGGSRSAVLDAATNEAAQRTLASTDANLRQQGFGTALSAAQNDAARQLAAGQQLGTFAQAEQQQQQSALQALYQEFQRQQQYPFLVQQLLNQSTGLLPSGTVGTSNGASSGFSIGPQSVSVGVG